MEHKMLVMGDLHLTEETPRSRIDNYQETLFGKLEFIFEIADKNDACILQPGDFFNQPTPSYEFFSKMVLLLKRYSNVPVFSIYGQHDLRYRNRTNTALKALNHACDNFFIIDKQMTYRKQYNLYGVSYGEEIPKVDYDKNNILLIHKMIIKDEKVWAGQTDYTESSELLKKNGFRIIVSGDNHKFFYDFRGEQKLFNCGSVMRSSVSQVYHKPTIFLIEGKSIEEIQIPIKRAKEVFRLEEIEKETYRSEEINSFIEGLSMQKEMGLDFEDNLELYCKENNIADEVKQVIKENMV
jgi:DNA repair protein SbcD/Mre11